MITGVVLLLASAQVAPTWNAPPPEAGIEGAEVRAVEVSTDGSVWLGVQGRGLLRIQGEEVEWMTTEDGLVSNGVADILEDSQGRVWAVGLGGFSVFDGVDWTAHARLGDLVPRVLFSAHEVPETGAMWLAGNPGAAKLQEGVWSSLEQSDGLPHQVVHAVVVGSDGVVWLGCRRGLARYADGAVTVQYPEVNFRSALRGPDGSVWFGTSDGVFRWDGSAWTRSLEGTVVHLRFVAADGTIWAGSAGSGLFRGGPDGWESVPLPEHMSGAEVFDLAEAPDGSIWVATSVGAIRYALPQPRQRDRARHQDSRGCRGDAHRPYVSRYPRKRVYAST